VISRFDKEREKLRLKGDRRSKYSKYIYELNLPIELDREELKREASKLRLQNQSASSNITLSV
jgi:hypothetical protein